LGGKQYNHNCPWKSLPWLRRPFTGMRAETRAQYKKAGGPARERSASQSDEKCRPPLPSREPRWRISHTGFGAWGVDRWGQNSLRSKLSALVQSAVGRSACPDSAQLSSDTGRCSRLCGGMRKCTNTACLPKVFGSSRTAAGLFCSPPAPTDQVPPSLLGMREACFCRSGLAASVGTCWPAPARP